MSNLQIVAFGAASDGSQGDSTRAAFTKDNANVAVLNAQAFITSFATTITAPTALTAASHLGKRVNVNFATTGTINLPTATSCGADGVILLRNLGTVPVTLAITAGSGDSVSMTTLNGQETALFDTDGIHAWNVLVRGRGTTANETVNGNSIVAGNETVGGTLAVTGATTLASATVGGNLALAGTVTSPGALSYAPTNSNSAGSLSVAPSGTSTVGQFVAYGKSDTANASTVAMYVSGTSSIINTSKTGTGVVNPLDIYSNGVYTARFTSTGTVPQLILGSTTAVLTTAALNITSSTSGYHIGYLNPAAASGHIWLSGPNSANNFVLFNGSLTGVYVADGATAWAGQSDERLKNIRSEITGAVAAINDIRTVRYTWKEDDAHNEALGEPDDARVYIGVIAQDVQRHVPEAVSVSHDEYLGVAYTDLVPLCMAAIKELSAQVAELQARLK